MINLSPPKFYLPLKLFFNRQQDSFIKNKNKNKKLTIEQITYFEGSKQIT